MPLIETEEAARRLARAIASDLSLYNEEKIIRGIETDHLFEELSEEIEEGRALDPGLEDVEERFTQAVRSRTSGGAGEALQQARSEFSRDNPHQPTVTRP